MRKYLIGILIGASLMFSMQSFAAVGDHVDAIFANFNFIVNGHAKTLDATPIVVNGSSYLPVKDISNALGYDVTYKADSRTIELNQSVTGSIYATPTPEPMTTPAPTPHVSPVPSESVVTPPPSSDTIEVNTGGATMSDSFYIYTSLDLDLVDKISNPLITNNNGTYSFNLNNKSEVLVNNVDYFLNENTNIFYLSKTLLLKFLTADYLSKFDEFNIDIANKTVTKIN